MIYDELARILGQLEYKKVSIFFFEKKKDFNSGKKKK